MPIDPKSPFAGPVALVGAPYAIRSWMLVVTLECRQCEALSTVTLVNHQAARCPHCGAEYACGGMRWDVTTPGAPQLAISAGPPAKPSN